MKKILLAGLLVLAISCSTTTTITTPFFYSNNSNYDFLILGEVTYSSRDMIGFQGLLNVAKKMYPDANYVIDIMIDQKLETTISRFLFFPPSQSMTYTYTLRGTAIQYVGYTPVKPVTSIDDVLLILPYTVQSVKGTVMVRRETGNGWNYIRVNDVLTLDTIVFIGRNSLLTITIDGGNILTISSGTGRDGLKISELISMN